MMFCARESERSYRSMPLKNDQNEMEQTSAGASVRSTGADVTTGASVGGDPPLQAGTAWIGLQDCQDFSWFPSINLSMIVVLELKLMQY